MPRPDPKALAAFLGFVVLAGANGTAVAVSLRELGPFWGAALRFLAAAAILGLLTVATRRRFPRGRAAVGALLYGLLGFLGVYAFIYWAFRTVAPGVAQVILAVSPLMTLLLAVGVRQEAFRWQALAGSLVCIAGILVIFSRGLRDADGPGIVALLLAAACGAGAAVVNRHFPRGDLMATNVVAMALAGVGFLVLSLAARETMQPPAARATWIALAYLVLVGSVVAFTLFLVVLRHWPATVAAYQWVLLPLVAVPVSSAFTGERLTGTLLLGGLLVLLGVYVGAFLKGGRAPGPPARAPSP